MVIKTKNEYVRIEEGSGDNLIREDIEAGYVTYVDFTGFTLSDDGEEEETDGGMFLYKEDIRNIEDTVPDVLDQLFDSRDMDYTVLADYE